MAEIVYRDRETIVSNTLYTDGQIKTVTIGKLVRCKDCTEYQQNFHWCRLHDGEMQATDFCSYGERKGGEQP